MLTAAAPEIDRDSSAQTAQLKRVTTPTRVVIIPTRKGISQTKGVTAKVMLVEIGPGVATQIPVAKDPRAVETAIITVPLTVIHKAVTDHAPIQETAPVINAMAWVITS